MRANVSEYNVFRWAGRLITELAGCGLRKAAPVGERDVNFLLAPRFLWAFDFDGTVSRIVPDRPEARLHRRAGTCSAPAEQPVDRVAVISSRALDDIVPGSPPGAVHRRGKRAGMAAARWNPHPPGLGRGKASFVQPNAVGALFEEIAAIPAWSGGQAVVRCDPLPERLPRSFRRRTSAGPAEKPDGDQGVPRARGPGGTAGEGRGKSPGCGGSAGWPDGIPPGRDRVRGDERTTRWRCGGVAEEEEPRSASVTACTCRGAPCGRPGRPRARRPPPRGIPPRAGGSGEDGGGMTPFDVRTAPPRPDERTSAGGQPEGAQGPDRGCNENVLFHHYCETTLRTTSTTRLPERLRVWAKLYLATGCSRSGSGSWIHTRFHSLEELRARRWR